VNNNLSNGAFADDLICLTNSLSHVQADNFNRYSDWAALQISGSKTKVTGILHKAASTRIHGKDPTKNLQAQLLDKIKVQGQNAKIIKQDEPFLYLGVELTTNLNWTHQHQCMRETLKQARADRSERILRLTGTNNTHLKHCQLQCNNSQLGICIPSSTL
jgi:hypothetical protein